MSLLGNINLTKKFPDSGKNYHDKQDSYFAEFKNSFPEEAKVILKNATSFEVRPMTRTVEAALLKNDKPCIYPLNDPHYDKAFEYADLYFGKILNVPVKLPSEEVDFNAKSSSGIIGKKTGFPKTREYLQSKQFAKYKLNTTHIPIKIINEKDELLDMESDLSRDKVRLVDCEEKAFLYKQKLLYDNQNAMLAAVNIEEIIAYGFVKQYGGFDKVISSFEDAFLVALSDISL